MKTRNYIIGKLLLLFFVLSSCQEMVLGDEEANTPENNFEIFWKDFDNYYGLFHARNHNWDSIYTVYRPQVNSQTTDEELFAIFSEMIDYLDDSHTSLYNPQTEDLFRSGTSQKAKNELSIPLIKDKYIENTTDIPVIYEDEYYFYGNIKNKDIGYIYLNGIETDDIDLMDKILQEIGKHQAIILDIRSNFGGDDPVATAFAGRFANKENFIYTVQHRNGKEHNDFSDKIEYYTKPIGKENYSKPVIILTDNVTISAAEIFLLHMKSFPQVTQMGDTTSGDFSDISMRRFLPNGFQYRYSIMMFLLPNGQSLDGIGHIPNIYIRNSENDIKQQNDKVLQRAIEYLFEEYGIE
ncbi:S41 family peptidase [Bernardetia sp.]|uniref:S41 family peptidase n=1 Tax=Bernardetia sp. TaxID=1937974 RepID=UPI0025C70856|nr:S41 family peptidase [Bernardetia sp.]